MQLAFILFRYFPYGGLQRDFLRIAHACHLRGHKIEVYVLKWEGDIPDWLCLHILPQHGWTNHGRSKVFAKDLQTQLSTKHYDAIIGFNKLPGLDFYFSADVCFIAQEKYASSRWRRYLPRYATYAALEKAVFDKQSTTRIFLLTEAQKKLYQTHYHTPESRMKILPPGIATDRVAPPESQTHVIRQQMRSQAHINENQFILLFIGSSFHTKGLDRAITALAATSTHFFHNVHLWILGKDDAQPYFSLIKNLHVQAQVKFIEPTSDILPYLLAADLLIHPARLECAGAVLLEALVAGLPVLATEICGYAPYITQAACGTLISHPFEQTQLNHKLIQMLDKNLLEIYRHAALRYAAKNDLHSLVAKVVEDIESFKRASNYII